MFDAYQIGVSIALTNNVSFALQDIAKDAEKTEEKLSGFQKRMEEFKKAIKPGQEQFEFGKGLLEKLDKPIEETAKLQAELAKFSGLGFGDAVNEQAQRFAEGMEVAGQSVTENVKLLREISSMTNSFSDAKALAPMMAQLKSTLEISMGVKEGDDVDAMAKSALAVMLQRGDLRDAKTGAVDVEKAHGMLDLMFKTYEASDGAVKFQDFADMAKQGGMSTQMMSDQSFFSGLGYFMQKSGGSAVGTQAMSMFSDLALGKMTPEVAENLNKLNLLDHSAIHRDKDGKIKSVDPMGIKDSTGMTQNPFKWVIDTVLPALKKQGLDGSAADIKLASMLGVKDSTNLVDQFVRDQKLAQQYSAKVNKARGLDSMAEQDEKSYAGQVANFKNQVAELQNELGKAVLPRVVDLLQVVNPLLQKLVDIMRDHPMIVKTLTDQFLVLGSVMMIGGTINSTKAALGLINAEFLGGTNVMKATAEALKQPIGQMSKLGATSSAVSAFFIGWDLGTWLYNAYIQGTKFSDWLGGWIAKMLAWAGDKDAQEAQRAHFAYMSPADKAELEKEEQAKLRRQLTTISYGGKVFVRPSDSVAEDLKAMQRSSNSDPAKNVSMPPPTSNPGTSAETKKGADADGGKAAGAAQAQNSQASITVNLHMDSKQIASVLVPPTTRGTVGFNTAGSQMTPSMGSLGVG